jgi:hypothetical protein
MIERCRRDIFSTVEIESDLVVSAAFVFVTKTADSAGSRRKRRIRRRRYNRRRVREGGEDQADGKGSPKSFEPAPQRTPPANALFETRSENIQAIGCRPRVFHIPENYLYTAFNVPQGSPGY